MQANGRSGVARLPFRQTLAAAFRETLNGIGVYWTSLLVSILAWTAVGGLRMPLLLPEDASAVPVMPEAGPGLFWQVKLAMLLMVALVSTTILAMNVQRQVLAAGDTQAPLAWPTVARRGVRYGLKLAAFVALSAFLWVVAGRIGSWMLATAVLFADPVLGGFASKPGFALVAGVLEPASFVLTGLLLHIPVMRMLPLLAATAVADPYMTFSESYEWSSGSGWRLIAGTVISLLAIPVAILCFVYALKGIALPAVQGWIARAAWSAVVLLGMCISLGFIAVSYRHFAIARERVLGGAQT